MPIITLDNVSLAFGHLPLFERADLRIEAGERIALIGRNGSGKSSLLRLVSGEMPPDKGTIWRSPGLQISRLDQDVQAAGDRTVFDEVSDGLGELGALVADYHHAAMDAASSKSIPPPNQNFKRSRSQARSRARVAWRSS